MLSAHRPRPPLHARPWAWALGLSLLAHAALLLRPSAPRQEVAAATSAAPAALAAALQTRPLQPPAAAPGPAPTLPSRPRPAPVDPPQIAAAPQTPAPAAEETAATTAPASTATLVAPAAEWLYRLRQRGQDGLARLSWQPQDGGYRLRLERELGGRALPGWRSEGRLDAQGLAPQRYAQQRQGRQGWQDRQATNFRRDEGLISFSASSEQVELPPGVQDRISWWLQLAAVVAGAPQRFGPGSEIRLPVVGLRGEAREWVFEVVGEEPLALPGMVLASTLHLRRAALGDYDGAIEIWLDPSRGHLPVRLRVGRPDERGWELQLADDQVKP